MATVGSIVGFSLKKQKRVVLDTVMTYIKEKKKQLSFKEDIVAAFSIALVTIPLSIGIAVAAGVPPMAGILSSIAGGIIATFFRSSNLTVNGPATSLIIVTITCIQILGQGDAIAGFRYFLAASVCAGGLLMLISFLRLGRYGDIFPTSVIYGILGAIGVMILSQQAPVALGVDLDNTTTTLESISQIPQMLINQNPAVGLIGLLSIGLLIGYSYLNVKILKVIPAPLWVILISVLLALVLGYQNEYSFVFWGTEHQVNSELLVQMPTSIKENIFFPDFSKINSFSFWRIVLLITLIVFIETIISSRAMDKIDPYGRQTNLNHDLFACGMSTSLVAFIGGLPIITAVPMYYGAKTKWANFFQGILLLLFVLFFPHVVQWIPLAALAALLIYTGYKLASPKIFKDTYRLGLEQFVVLAVTLIIILSRGVLVGTFVGFMITLLIQQAKSNLKRKQFIRYLLKPIVEIKEQSETEMLIETKGVINFINILPLKEAVRKARGKEQLVLDMSNTRLVDSTVLEYLHEEVEKYEIPKVRFEIIGLDAHETSSRHPNAMHVLPENKKPSLTKRQQALAQIAEDYSGEFWPEIRWDVSQFKQFNFFKTRPIDYKLNTAKGNYLLFIEWESCDITFEQGALFNSQARHTSVLLLHLPFNAPTFVMTREGVKEKLGSALSYFNDIDFLQYPVFSAKYLLSSPNEEEVRDYFSEKLIRFFEEETIYQIECNGTMVMIYKEMRFASPNNMIGLHQFSQSLAKLMLETWKEKAKKLKATL